jgi:hypothetical protein
METRDTLCTQPAHPWVEEHAPAWALGCRSFPLTPKPIRVGSGEPTADGMRRKLAVLRQHCDALRRPFDSVLRTHFTGWLILAENDARLQTKLKHYFPEGQEQRFSGPWSSFVFAGTPEQAITYYQEHVNVGIQYFIVQTLDAADEETIRLLAEQVMPAITK